VKVQVQIGLGALQKTLNYQVVLEYLLLPQYLFPEEHLEVTYLVIIPKLNIPVWRKGVGLGREHVQVLNPVAAVGIILMFPLT